MKNYFIIIAIILFATACQKPLEINYPEQEPALVVNCLFSPDSLFVARISRTTQTDDSTDLSISDANCEIWSDGEKLATLTHSENGFYSNPNLTAEAGKAYTIKVSHTDYPSVSATDTVPEQTIISEIYTEYFTRYDPMGEDHFNKLYLKINDNPNKIDFYQIRTRVLTLYIDKEWDGDTTWTIIDTLNEYSPIYLSNNSLLLRDEDIDENKLTFFSDKYFNGNNTLLGFEYSLPFGGSHNDEGYHSDHDLIIEFKTISNQYYNYTKQIKMHVYSQYSDLYIGMSDPVQMTTNIKNGYGIFAAYNPQIFILHYENEF